MRGAIVLALGAALLVTTCLAMSALAPTCAAAPASDHCASWLLALPLDTVLGLLSMAVIGACLLGALAVSASIRHWLLAMELDRQARPGQLAGVDVRLIDGLDGPCVAGLARPTIYCPADLAGRLSQSELRAVILHERHHQITAAPRRLLMLTVLAAVGGRFAMTRPWLEGQRATIEIEADEQALRQGATASALARAIIKLGPARFEARLPGYTSATDLRLRHLVGADPAVISESRWPLARLVGAAGVALVIGCWLGVLG